MLYKFLLGFVNEDDTFLIFLFRFGLTAVYLFAIQHFTRVGGKISVMLIKYENNETAEKRADSLVYKVLTRISYIPCGFSCPFMGDLLLFKTMVLIALAGLWSLFHADIYWSFLSCSLAPQFFDSPPSLDSASSYI